MEDYTEKTKMKVDNFVALQQLLSYEVTPAVSSFSIREKERKLRFRIVWITVTK